MSEQQPEARALPGVTRWRRKMAEPFEVEAVELIEDLDWEAVARWCGGRLETYDCGAGGGDYETRLIVPLERGDVAAYEGDFLVRRPDGKFEVRDFDRGWFAATYEPAGEEKAPAVPPPPVAAALDRSSLRLRPDDQQLPVPNDGPSMHDLAADDVRRRHPGGRAPEIAAVVRDLAARKQLGLDRYGSLLQAHNGRDALRDLHEEQLDSLVYCRQWLEENEEDHVYAVVMRAAYRDLLTGALTVRRVMDGDVEGTDHG